jgi:hypothetical protein
MEPAQPYQVTCMSRLQSPAHNSVQADVFWHTSRLHQLITLHSLQLSQYYDDRIVVMAAMPLPLKDLCVFTDTPTVGVANLCKRMSFSTPVVFIS